jgi:hypothetical protein
VRRVKGAVFFGGKTGLDTLAVEQNVCGVSDFDTLLGDFWPEGESVDQFIATMRAWRRDGKP